MTGGLRTRPAPALVLRGVAPYGGDPCDLRIRDGVLVDQAPRIEARDELVVDAAGLIALPALVDLHTHLREPGGEAAEDIGSGTRAAAAGGYGAVFAMANTSPVVDSGQVAEYVAERAAAEAMCDVRVVGAVTQGLGGVRLADLEAMHASRAAVTMFSDDGRCVSDPVLMREALARVGALGGFVAQHAQSPELAGQGQVNARLAAALDLPGWPLVGESVIVARDLMLLAEAADRGARLHVCHVSTPETVELVRWGKRMGWPVTAEVCPHHLVLADDRCVDANPVFKVNPPLREQAVVAALRAGLADGAIDAVATDHAPHPPETKARPWLQASFGLLGLETALAATAEVMLTDRGWGWRDIARVMSETPARIGGLADLHGRPIAVGEPANLCLVDPRANWQTEPAALVSRSRNTPFAGTRFSARVVATLVRGHVTFDERARFGSRL